MKLSLNVSTVAVADSRCNRLRVFFRNAAPRAIPPSPDLLGAAELHMTRPTDAPPCDDSAEGQSDERHETPLRSEDLLQGRHELLIEHAGEVYRLRVTRNGKLILHK